MPQSSPSESAMEQPLGFWHAGQVLARRVSSGRLGDGVSSIMANGR